MRSVWLSGRARGLFFDWAFWLWALVGAGLAFGMLSFVGFFVGLGCIVFMVLLRGNRELVRRGSACWSAPGRCYCSSPTSTATDLGGNGSRLGSSSSPSA